MFRATGLAAFLLFFVTAHAVDIDAILFAAEQGNIAAMTTMASLYRHGRGVPQSYAESAFWYLRAAGQGHAGAQAIASVSLKMHEIGRFENADRYSSWFFLKQMANISHYYFHVFSLC